MILVDTSVWIDHCRFGNPAAARVASAGAIERQPRGSNRERTIRSTGVRSALLQSTVQSFFDRFPSLHAEFTAKLRGIADAL
jgi:hypothetical protein